MTRRRLLNCLLTTILTSVFLLLIFGIISLHLPKAQAADSSDPAVITTTPADTQDFFSTHGIASVERDPATGQWGTVTLTPDGKAVGSNNTGIATLNNRIDITKKFSIKFSLRVQNGMGDGFSNYFYPGDVGTVGLSGGNLGIAGLPDGLGMKLDAFYNQPFNGWVQDSDKYFNLSSDMSSSNPYSFLFTYFQSLLKTWGVINMNPTLPGQTQNYINTLKDYSDGSDSQGHWAGAGTLFGQLDDGFNVPYGALMQTDKWGIMNILSTPGSSNLYGGTVKSSGPDNSDPSSNPLTAIYDGNWHGFSADYTVAANGLATLTFGLYDNPDNIGNTSHLIGKKVWSETINTNKLMTSSVDSKTLMKYFAMNISAAIGSNTALQQIKDLYASYTPEPGAVTMRYVDQNGMSIKDADNFGNAQDLNQKDPGFNHSAPYRFTTSNNRTFVLDYVSYIRYDNPDSNPIKQVSPSNIKPTGLQTAYLYHADGSDDMTFYGAYTVPYQRINFHYKQEEPLFSKSSSLTDTTNSQLSATATQPVATPLVGDELNYKIQVANPKLGADPWDKLTATVTIPASLKYIDTKDYPTNTRPTVTNHSDGSTTVTFTSANKDSNGKYPPFFINNGETFSATLIVQAVTAGAWDNLTTTFSEGYIYDTDQKTPTTYYTQSLKDVSPYQIAGPHVATLKLNYQASDNSGGTYTNTDGLSNVDQTLPTETALTDVGSFDLSQAVPPSFTALYGTNKTFGKFVLDTTKTQTQAGNAGIELTTNLQGQLTAAQIQAGVGLTVYYQLTELNGFDTVPTLNFGIRNVPDNQAVQFLNDGLDVRTGQKDTNISNTLAVKKQSVDPTVTDHTVTVSIPQLKTPSGSILPTDTTVYFDTIVVPTDASVIPIWKLAAGQTGTSLQHTFTKITLTLPPLPASTFNVQQTYTSTATYQLTESI